MFENLFGCKKKWSCNSQRNENVQCVTQKCRISLRAQPLVYNN